MKSEAVLLRWLRLVQPVLLLLLALAGFTAPNQAQAQDIDWLVNMSDVGFEGSPAGGTVNYAITVSNNGNDPTPATSMTFSVPAGTSFTGGVGTITGCLPASATGPATITCNVPSLITGASATLTASVATTVAGTITVSAAVPNALDVDSSNNSVSEQTTIVAGADVSLALTGPASAGSGSVISYTFTATNNGPNPLSNTVLQVPVPAGLVNIVAPPGCTLGAGVYSCAITGPVAVGASVPVNFSGQISAGAGSTVTAAGSVSGGTPADPIATNNTATLNTTVTAGSDLSIGKSRSPSGPLLVGATATFNLTPRYTGDSPNNITVVDTVPANYTINLPINAPGWTCSVLGQQVTCTRPAGSGSGAAVSLGSISIQTTVASSGSPTNVATISAAGPIDPNPANNSANDGGATILDPVVDLQAGKSGPVPALVVVGNSYNFSISTSNVGNTAFYGTAVMQDTLPAGMTLTAISPNGWTCTPPPPLVGSVTLECTRVYTLASPLAAGATAPVVSYTTEATAAGTLVNSLTVSAIGGNLPDLNSPNDTVTYSVSSGTPANSADISVVKTRSLASLPAGDVQTFQIEITNAGPATSSNVSMTDDIGNLINSSVGLTGAGYISESIVANSATGVSCSSVSTGGTSRRLTCTVATLPPCTTGSTCPVITVQVRPGGNPATRSNTANVTSNTTPDANLGNNASTVSYAIEARADVTVTKNDSPDPAVAGQNLTYVITARNTANGLSAAEGVTITDTLPLNVTFISATPSVGSCTAPAANSTTTAGNRTVNCSLGTINNGAQQTVTVIVRPNLVTRGTTISNDVVVATTTTETNSANNSASATTAIGSPSVDLVTNKVESVDPLTVGEQTVYTVTITNLGPSAAENVVMTDNMPPSRIEYISHVAPGDATCGTVPAVNSLGGTLICTFPVIPAGQSRAVQITGLAVAKGTGTNTASGSSDETLLGFESNTANDVSSENTSVRTRADVEVASKVANPGTVNLRDPFNFVITVRNNAGAGRSEADNTIVTDTLPAGIELTGTPTVAVVAGTASSTTCTGVAGGTSFSCSLGTFSLGAEATITVPVRVVTITSDGQSFTNTASISTSSFDDTTSNNSSSGPVVVNASSIAGTVFRDFNNNAAVTAGDTGISGVTMTLTGTAFDGTAISRTVTTDSSGNYSFGLLPQGTYAIAQGAIAETYLTNGTTTAGSSGGTVAPTAITNVVLAGDTNATGYLFPKVPQARVMIAKQLLSGPTINSDGSYSVSFRMRVQNPSLESLSIVAVTDTLQGAAPNFGTHTAATPTVPGTYTVVTAPTGSCGGLNAAFNGASNVTLASGFTLASGVTCQINLQMRVMPTNPLPPVLATGERYLNQASVNAVGALSGQTSATNPQLTDLSERGTNPDPDGDGQGNEAGENRPTRVFLTVTPRIRLVKSLVGVTDTTGDGLIGVGDTVSYRFAVTNTGQTALAGITISDPLITMSGGPISLAIGATNSTNFTGSYVLVQADIDRGYLQNTATTNGNAVAADGSPFLNDSGVAVTVTDVSDTGTAPTNGAPVPSPETTESPNGLGGTDLDPTNDPTVAVLARQPRIVLVKSLVSVVDTTGDAQIGAGDTANYSFSVTNTGNVALAGVTVIDPLVTVTGGPIALAIGATDNTTFTASYTLVQADIDRGYVENTAEANGNAVTAGGAPILGGGGVQLTASDTSDTGTDPGGAAVADPANTETPDGNGGTDADPTNDPTVATLGVNPRIVLVKSLASLVDTTGDGIIGAGDTANYSFSVRNTGNVAIRITTITDSLVSVTGGPITLAVGATDTSSFTATYTLLQADIDRGYIENTASVTGTAVDSGGTPILDSANNPVTTSDTSDTGTDPDGATITNPETVESPDGSGGTDADPTNDPTVSLLAPAPRVALEKRLASVADTNADGLRNAGDTATYAFTVTNTGATALIDVTVTDPGAVMAGGPIAFLAIGASDTTTFSATYVITQADVDRGYFDNTAAVTGDAARADGSPILDTLGARIPATDVSDTGTAPDGTAVGAPATTETPSGDGTTDADPTNDPTSLLLGPDPRIVLVKSLVSVVDTTGDGQIGAGDTANYSFSVRNSGNVALAGVTVTDPLVAVSGGPIALAIGATDTTTFTAAYTLLQADIDRGYVENTAQATGNAVTAGGVPILDSANNPVTTSDTSDTGTDPGGAAVADPANTETPDGTGGTDADPTNDPTVATLPLQTGIRLVKRLAGTTDVNGNGFVDLGDLLNYTFEVTNLGNVALSGVTVSDPLATVTGGPITLAVGETNSIAFTASYAVTAADVIRTYVENTATADGNAVTAGGAPILDGGGLPVTVSDTSDSGTNPDGSPVTDPENTETPDGGGNTDGDTTNDPTVASIGRPEILLDIAIASIVDTNGNGITDAGDNIFYSFTVTNTGTLDLTNVDLDYGSLSLPFAGLVCTPISLPIGATQTLVCTGNSYTITPADVVAGSVTLSGTARGESAAGVVVNDDDAVVSPALGLGGLTITKVVDRGQVNPGEVVTYTITVTNTSTTLTTVTNIVDVLPAGFIYQSGSATVGGGAVEPAISGRTLTWAGVSLAPTASTTVVLDVLVSASASTGNHDNLARGISPATGLAVTADAIATVRIAADPVFDCSSVIGRVFDDRNQDGYYNGLPEGQEAKDLPQREKGLPGVRLIAPNGLAITTDEHGRFSVPCAALPAAIGSNFMLKLDTRTLPSGYRLTTENPRVVRLTAGMLTKLNFGATISRVVRVDLSDRAFGNGEDSMTPRVELEEGLKAMVAQIADTPTMLRLSYQLSSGESQNLARQRLNAVERILRKLWPANGRYQLNVEAVIQRWTAEAVNE